MFKSILTNKKKKLAVLIDPDKLLLSHTAEFIKKSQKTGIDFFLVGGSLISVDLDKTVQIIKNNTNLPVILFPGSLFQLSNKADGILLLSLISGKNPDLLIGNHIIAAPFLKKSKLEIIPTGYILIDGGKKTSVEYISNTSPVPNDKPDIATAVAMAGEMTGKKLIYLEAGSGAKYHVPEKIIASVKKNIDIPLVVGGGIRNAETINKIYKAGADIVVVGTAFEKDFSLIKQFAKVKLGFL